MENGEGPESGDTGQAGLGPAGDEEQRSGRLGTARGESAQADSGQRDGGRGDSGQRDGGQRDDGRGGTGSGDAGREEPEPTGTGGAATDQADTGPGEADSGDPGPGATEQGGRRWRELFLSLPALVVTTVVVGFASWGVTRVTDGAESLARDADPLATVSVETNPRKVGAFQDTAVSGVLPDGATPTSGPGDGCTGFHDWLMDSGGTDAGESRLQVAVQGNAERQVQIANLRVVVVSREDPAPSVGVNCPTAGEASLRFLSIDLDHPQPTAEYLSEDGTPFGFTVESGEIETFLISATAEEAAYEWHLELDLVSGGEEVTVVVDDDGSDFRTAPAPETPGWEWDWDSRWYHAPSGQERVVGDRLVHPVPAGGTAR